MACRGTALLYFYLLYDLFLICPAVGHIHIPAAVNSTRFSVYANLLVFIFLLSGLTNIYIHYLKISSVLLVQLIFTARTDL
jgi:hypothetical protein